MTTPSVEHEVLVPMRDGVCLACDVHRPSSAGRHPVLVARTPYGKARTPLPDEVNHFVACGYTVVVQDTRGRFGSVGDFTPFHDEVADGHDTITWAAAQPWSTGNVGMLGSSYLGLTQLMAAATAPPALKAIAPRQAPAALYDDFVFHAGGAMDAALVMGWTLGVAEDSARRLGVSDPELSVVFDVSAAVFRAFTEGDEHDVVRALERQRETIAPYLDVSAAAIHPGLSRVAPFLSEWKSHESDPGYWASASPCAYYHGMTTPAVHTVGWYDRFIDGTLNNYVGLTRHAATAEARQNQKLIVGPWAHQVTFDGQVGELDFGPDAVLDVVDIERRWMDYWLKGTDASILQMPPVQIFVMGENRWRAEDQWPLARTQWHRYFLRGNGRSGEPGGFLSVTPPGAEPPDHFVFDPARPVPTIGGHVGGPITPGPFDQREVEARPDVLTYTTEPLEADVEVTGNPVLELWASSSATDTDFTAKLVDVYPDGQAIVVSEGMTRARYRWHRAYPTPLVPEAIYAFSMRLPATSNLFSAGHCLRVEVSSSNFPLYDCNPNNWSGTRESAGAPRPARQAVFHDSAHPSALVVPIIPR